MHAASSRLAAAIAILRRAAHGDVLMHAASSRLAAAIAILRAVRRMETP